MAAVFPRCPMALLIIPFMAALFQMPLIRYMTGSILRAINMLEIISQIATIFIFPTFGYLVLLEKRLTALETTLEIFSRSLHITTKEQ